MEVKSIESTYDDEEDFYDVYIKTDVIEKFKSRRLYVI